MIRRTYLGTTPLGTKYGRALLALAIILLEVTAGRMYAQSQPLLNPDLSTPALWSSPQAKVLLQLDRSVYARGETIWFNAYLSAPEATPVGSTLQAELWKEDSLCIRMQYPVALGVSSGQFTLPSTSATGWYYIRAFTEEANLIPFQTSLYVIGKETPPRINKIAAGNGQLFFYPESGPLVEGIESHVAFKAIDSYGKPATLSGTIQTEQGSIVTSFSTWHQGMGEFYLRPEPGQTYYAHWTEQGAPRRVPLGPVQLTGSVLSMIDHPEGFLFELTTTEKDSLRRQRWLIGTKEGQEVFRLPLSSKVNTLQGVLRTKQLTSGILNVAVLDALGKPMASRNVFVNNHEYRSTFSLQTDTVSWARKAKNKWTLQWPDSLEGTISIAVTDAELDGGHFGRPSLLAQKLLLAPLREEVTGPDWFFNTTADSASIGLDLLLLTSLKIDSPTAVAPPPTTNTDKKGYITVKGQAFFKDTRQPLANAKLIVVLSAPRIRNNILFTETDPNGRFSIDSLLFFGAARFIFAEHRPPKKARPIDIRLDQSSLPPLSVTTLVKPPEMTLSPSPLPMGDADWLKKMEAFTKEAEGVMLEGVTIKTRVKSPLEKLQEEYTRGAFETDAFVERVIDLVNNDEATTYPNIFEFLRFRVPGLQVVDPDYSKSPPDPSQSGGFEMQNDPTKYRIFYRQLPSASSMGNPPMVIYLNEIEVDADILLTIPAAEIALVKLFSSFTAAPGGGAGGALAIYTKKPELLKSSTGNAVTFTGYTPIKSYPELNYEKDASLRERSDGRVTLFWRSNLFLNGERGRMPIEFFNSDRTKRFRIVVEGITTNGQPLLMEKIVEQGLQ